LDLLISDHKPEKYQKVYHELKHLSLEKVDTRDGKHRHEILKAIKDPEMIRGELCLFIQDRFIAQIIQYWRQELSKFPEDQKEALMLAKGCCEFASFLFKEGMHKDARMILDEGSRAAPARATFAAAWIREEIHRMFVSLAMEEYCEKHDITFTSENFQNICEYLPNCFIDIAHDQWFGRAREQQVENKSSTVDECVQTAMALSNSGRHRQAIQLLTTGLSLFAEVSEDAARLLSARGIVEMKLGTVEAAIKTCKEAQELHSKLEAVNPLHVARNLDTLGSSYRKSHQYEKALECFEEAWRQIRECCPGEDCLEATVVGNVAHTRGLLERITPQQAIQLLDQAEQIRRDTNQLNTYAAGLLFKERGDKYAMVSDIKSAWADYKKAEAILDHLEAMGTLVGAELLKSIADLAVEKGEELEARKCYEKAKHVREKFEQKPSKQTEALNAAIQRLEQRQLRLHRNILWHCQEGTVSDVTRQLDWGAHVNTRSTSGSTPLITAALRGDLAIVEILLNRRADVLAKSKKGKTALSHASMQQHWSVLKKLLDWHQNTVAEASDQERANLCSEFRELSVDALVNASQHGNVPAVQRLLELRANIHGEASNGTTALWTAGMHERRQVVELLLTTDSRLTAPRARSLHLWKCHGVEASEWKVVREQLATYRLQTSFTI